MKTIAKIFREGQNFYIQHTPGRGKYDNIESVGDEDIVVKMLDNKKEYESGYLFIYQEPVG